MGTASAVNSSGFTEVSDDVSIPGSGEIEMVRFVFE
jgi:hypothetical protein